MRGLVWLVAIVLAWGIAYGVFLLCMALPLWITLALVGYAMLVVVCHA